MKKPLSSPRPERLENSGLAQAHGLSRPPVLYTASFRREGFTGSHVLNHSELL